MSGRPAFDRGADEPGVVREPLDLERLQSWLDRALPGFGVGGALEVAQFASGYSNLTYLVRSGDDELVLRRPPVGSAVASAHDMVREARVLTALAPFSRLVPNVLAVCDDPGVLGAPFFAMERVRGLILRRDAPTELAADPKWAVAVGEAFVATLASLHAIDPSHLGIGHPEGYAERQLRGWLGRFERTAATLPADPGLVRVAQFLTDHPIGSTGPAGVVHNDFKLDNLVLDPVDPRRVRAVLDWEMATAGEPILDLGTTLGYWAEAGDPAVLLAFRSGPTHLPGMPTRRELALAWSQTTGRTLDQLVPATVFGLFKVAVIALQIAVRYAKGLTTDRRFAALPGVASALGARALATIESGEV